MPPSPRAAAAAPVVEDRSGGIIACSIVLTFIACVAVGLRFYVRGKLLRAIGREDWCILVALLLGIVSSGFKIEECRGGLGRHEADISPEGYMIYQRATWIGTLFYNLSLWATKVAILLLYLRVFSFQYIRKAIYGTLAIVVIYNVWGFAMYLTMCIPIQMFWDPTVKGYCHPYTVWWALTYLHIITDFIIFLLPLPVVLTMTIPTRRKVGLVLVFCLGLFVCLISVLRTIWLSNTDLSSRRDMTWDFIDVAMWTIAEVQLAIVCACLMTMKPLVRKIWDSTIMGRCVGHRHQSSGNSLDAAQLTIGSKSLRRASQTGRDQAMESTTLAALEHVGTGSKTHSSADSDKEKTEISSQNLGVSSTRVEAGPPPMMAHVRD